MLIRVTRRGLSSDIGGVTCHMDEDFFVVTADEATPCNGCCVFFKNNCPRPPCPPPPAMAAGDHILSATSPLPVTSSDRCWRSSRRNSSMSVFNVLRRTGSSNGYESRVWNESSAADDDGFSVRFSRRVHTSFMAHCRFCLSMNDSCLAEVPICELRKTSHKIKIFLILYFFPQTVLCYESVRTWLILMTTDQFKNKQLFQLKLLNIFRKH